MLVQISKLLDIFRTGCVCFCDPYGPPFSMKNNAFTALVKNGGLMTEWEYVPPAKLRTAGVEPIKSKPLSLKELDLIFIKVRTTLVDRCALS